MTLFPLYLDLDRAQFTGAAAAAVLLACVAVHTVAGGHHAPGYSYAKFSGPVSGPEKEVYVEHKDEHGHGHGHAIDYVAKPDYHFAYGVEDPKSKVSQSRKETRHGDTVHGEYSVVDPNGVLRVVKYTADKHNGFQAEVITSGGDKHGDEVVHYGAPAGDHHEAYAQQESEESDEHQYLQQQQEHEQQHFEEPQEHYHHQPQQNSYEDDDHEEYSSY